MTSPTPATVKQSDPLFAERYLAMSSRDARFDGQFITGVHSTGIYCRPSCPATTPKPANVTFYRTAAAAHEAGLRACKRCQPDAVPGSPEWNISDDVAARAMRLISDGTLEREGVPGLANRLGYTPRHLGRLLTRSLGAGALALSRAHRAQTARTLLVGTDLPIADVAFAAGFSSIRQFNETVQTIFETTPTALRQRGRRAGAHPASSGPPVDQSTSISLRLPARAPFDGPGLMRFFADHAIVGVETGDSESFSRLVRLPHGIANVELRLDGPTAVRVTASLSNIADLATLVERVRRLLDLDADSLAIDAALASDPAIAASISRHPGVRLPGSFDAEEALFRTMIGQQISVAAARTVLGRLASELGEAPGLFPTAATIAEHGHTVLRGPASRVTAVIGAAAALASGELQLDLGLSSAEFSARLRALRGVGQWTADYLAMRVLGNPNLMLSTDLVMLSSARSLGLASTPRGLEDYSLRWAPWRSYAGMHLWRSAPAPAGRVARQRHPPVE